MKTRPTTVHLPVGLYEALQRRALRERRPHAEIICEAVREWLAATDHPNPLPPLKSDPLWKVIESVPGGPVDEAESHDMIV
jgi:hypothetical protein